jgi:hypothetical protein
MDDIVSVPEITRGDVRQLVRDVGDGTFPSRDLYARYERTMVDQGRTPVSRTALGIAIGRGGQRPVTKYIGRKVVRCWVIREKFLMWLTPGTDEDLA